LCGMRPLGIIVFGCLTKPKYKQQLEDIWDTWGSEAVRLGCILRFYVGDIPEDIPIDMHRICINVQVGDDYISATFKQWRGLERMLDTEERCQFYYMCGSDTFLHVKNALATLAKFDAEKSLYIGGGMGAEKVDGTEYTYFSGGAGFFLTYSACQKLMEEFQEFIWWWLDVATPLVDYEEDGKLLKKSILAASDLQLGVLAKKVGLEWVKIDPALMVGVGRWDDTKLCKDLLLSIHPLSHDDFIAYDAYLWASGAYGESQRSVE
jgi:hypothetical protein